MVGGAGPGENGDLLVAGTEFALFFTVDGGRQWTELRGAPTIAFRDLEIQKREGDLVAATFGRGFFILDDISPLRQLKPPMLSREGVLFSPRRALAYNEIGYVGAIPGNETTPITICARTSRARTPKSCSKWRTRVAKRSGRSTGRPRRAFTG